MTPLLWTLGILALALVTMLGLGILVWLVVVMPLLETLRRE